MSLTRARQKQLFNACNPEDEVGPNDPRNVDLDARGGRGESSALRGFAARLTNEFELADGPMLRLVSGLPGSGKSTELLRLADRLSREDGAHLLAVVVDAETLLDLRVAIDAPDLLVLLLHHTERQVLAAEQRSPDEVWKAGSFERLWSFLTTTEASVPRAELGVGSVKIALDLKTNPELRTLIRERVRHRRPHFFRQVYEAFESLQRRTLDAGYGGLVLLVDSLEKLRGMTDDFEQVLRSAERLFADGAPDLALPIHVLYTVPPTVVTRIEGEIRVLPMIKLRTKEGLPYREGSAAATELIRRRIPQEDLAIIFGADAVEERLGEALAASGGYPREIVRMLRAVVAEGEFPLSREGLRRVLLRQGESVGRVALSHGVEGIRALARIHFHKRLLVGAAERQMMDHLVANNLILRYQNDQEWVDLHPAVLEIDLVQQAIRELEQQGGALGVPVVAPPVSQPS